MKMAAAASAGPGASGSVRGRFPGRPWVGRSGNREEVVELKEEKSESAPLRLALRSNKGPNSSPTSSAVFPFKEESPPMSNAKQASPTAATVKEECAALPKSMHGFTPDKIVRVHLTQLDPSLYGINTSFLLTPKESVVASRNHLTLPSNPVKEQTRSTITSRRNKRRKGKGKRLTYRKAPVRRQPKVAESVVFCQDVSSRDSPVALVEESPADEDTRVHIASYESEASKVAQANIALEGSSKPSTSDADQPTGPSSPSSRADGKVEEQATTMEVEQEKSCLPLKRKGRRDRQVRKVKWKLRAEPRQESEEEPRGKESENLEADIGQEKVEDERIPANVEPLPDNGESSEPRPEPVPVKEETPEKTLEDGPDLTPLPVEGHQQGDNFENSSLVEMPSEEVKVIDPLQPAEPLPETTVSASIQGTAPISEPIDPVDTASSVSDQQPPPKQFGPLRKSKKAKRTCSLQTDRTAAQKLIAKVKEAQSKAQSQLPAQPSKAVCPETTESVKPSVNARPSRVIKIPRRLIEEDLPNVTDAQVKRGLSEPVGILAELEKQVLSDAPADPCFSLFNEDDHLNMLPPASPRTDSTLTSSTPSSAASSPSLPPAPAPSAPSESLRKNILRAPTFRWNSFNISAPEAQETASSSQPPKHLSSPEPSEHPVKSSTLKTPSPSHLPSDPPPKPESKRSPLLRAPQFTPSEAHLKIYQSVSLQDNEANKASAVTTGRKHLSDHSSATVAGASPDLSPGTSAKESPTVGRRANHLALPLFADTVSGGLQAPHTSQISNQTVKLPEPVQSLNLKSERGLRPNEADASVKPLKMEAMTLCPGEVALKSQFQSQSMSSQGVLTFPPTELSLSGTDKKVINLLEKAKIQLFKIDKQKSADQGQDSPVQGPRIKHVCRHPAVALGKPRAMIPEDIPRLSALPLCEREAVVPAAAAAAEEAPEEESSASEPEPTTVTRQKPVRQSSAPPPRRPRPTSRVRLRMARCGKCKGCNVMEDCGRCVNCKDKTKFGGPNTKKQCCVYRRCERIEARRQQRIAQKGRKPIRHLPTRESSSESDDFFAEVCRNDDTEASERLEPGVPSQRKSTRRCVRQRPCYDLFPDSEDSDFDPSPSAPRRKQRRESDLLPQDSEEQNKPRRVPQQPVILRARSGQEQDSTLNGTSTKIKSSDGTHRLRVDFKEDCDLQNVWMMGGLSILTSFPVTPTHVCLLCASRGHHQFLYCQVCCEPFHTFCLEESERPLPEQEDSWCCQRCKFCNVCGHKGKAKKPLLECELCQTNYHIYCLGPNYPVKVPRSGKGWLCSSCVRCKSCGASPAVDADLELTEGGNLCTACSTLYNKGSFCPICSRCYEENDYDSKMIQCAKCDKWVHSKCEGLSDEGYEILSNLPESVVYTCPPCLGEGGTIWREAMLSELHAGFHEIIQSLLSSELSSPLRHCAQCSNAGAEGKCLHSPCDLQSLEKLLEDGHYNAIACFNDDVVRIIQQNMENGVLNEGGEALKALYIKLMEKSFSWFSVEDSKYWEKDDKSLATGVLPNAIMPPYSDHSYALWQDREDGSHPRNGEVVQPILPRKIKKEEDESGGVPEKDNRQCVLCLKYGDDGPKDAGRLLYIGQNEWTHINCAIWSAEVFEENDGSLRNVHAAVARGRQMRCEFCLKSGATVGCCLSTCQSNFHFMCARARNCTFQDDKKVFCQKHGKLLDGTKVDTDSFDVLRRVYVDFEGVSFRRKFLQGLEPENINMMIGAMKIDCLGMLTDLSVSEGKIYPVGYQCSRLYWSTLDARRRCWYKCRVVEHRPKEGDISSDGEDSQCVNRTIAHSSPGLVPESTEAVPASTPPPPEAPSLSHRPPPEPITTATAPRSFSGARMKMPNFSPSRKPLGGFSRPLPSPGSPSSPSRSHHILTVSDPEVTPLRRTRRPPGPPPPRVTRQSSTRVSRDSASPPPSPTSSPLARHSSSEAPSQLLTDIELMSSLDTELVTGPLPCGAQLLVGMEAPAAESDGASSSEEEPGGEYYGLTRTVVSNEPFSPLMSTTPPGRIEQLDGIHDSTDSEDPPQSHNGPMTTGKTPTHLPSEIVDFVLKSGEVTETDHTTQQVRVPSPIATTSPITQNGNSVVALSNGTDCVSYQSSQGPPPLRDPPQVQRVCRPLVPITPNGPSCPSDPASVTASKLASKFILVNKTTGQIIAVQDDSIDFRGQLRTLQEGANSDPHSLTKPTILRPNCKVAPRPINKTRIACLPPTTSSVLSSASPAPTPSIGTVFLQATPSGSPSITLRVLPMLNVVQGTGQLTLGAPTVMAPTIAGLPQPCLLQGLPVNTGLLSVAPTAVQTQVPPQMQAPLMHHSPPKNHKIQPATKRPCPVVNNLSPKKKHKLDMSDKLEHLDPHLITQSVAINLNCASETVTTTRYGQKSKRNRMKTLIPKEFVNLNSLDANVPTLDSEIHLDLTVDVKTEDPPFESPVESPGSEPPAGFSPNFEDFEERFLAEKENTLSKKGRPHLRFEIISEDGFYTHSYSAEGAWKAVVEKVQEARSAARLRQLSFSAGLSGARMLGVQHDAVLFLLEQLLGAERCRGYNFHFHPQEVDEEVLLVNPTGCARSEYYVRKCTFDMFNFLASRHRTLPEMCAYEEEEEEVQLKSTRRATSLDLPMAMRFRHLKKTSKEAVGVYRSSIHGRGLFCKRNIDVGEMVIEYSGIVIRAVLTDKREKFYDSKGIGCYMFRIDDFDVVDATMHGNAARFINHSCEPNCYSRVIHVEGQKHIVIFALRSIYRGEELTYDYKFPIEDPSNKLSCNCGAKKCRRFLN
ncbi:PREDICTED: histone-lysine N-methyltransferase 2B [Nanorana parkeri]|uniref:histone-lysine N-methyltransferase 2B n=1 Tax=Nanorana parkeri TaxID=125878 RepID=UPI000854D0DC|nr:PREDICTED: histone-lysine N-methyltransferase 2B [Nanorana parkeri]